ncbi:transcriptional regulator, GntR family with aminotransferase domain protein [Janthinobacterium agaricidamnosum NBRC 102515 = DSM 9628]|uniref:Transcriptional regulator, GntR family with aminotransferase domain protein n=1 Tax=Janthinobacterium agaricidamnosum NBRC 102515 = DSM 9628 TaxID=1349767 RepID=W0V7S6_9BURK|nr:transcriptional regulator, GntR family with aminotransferase domain protein [Janthinobacterium agaricidamnosum NBRC 102515 = DSM 9628]
MAGAIGHLERLGFKLWTRPEAGMFVWAALPEGLVSSDIAQRAGIQIDTGAGKCL